MPEIANTTILSKLESKLPSHVSNNWTQFVIKKKLNKKTTGEKFNRFLSFLQESKEMAKYSMCEIRAGNNPKSHCFVTGLSHHADSKTQSKPAGRPSSDKVPPHPCLACNVDGATDLSACQHSMDSCVAWGSLSHNQRLAKVQCKNTHSEMTTLLMNVALL